MRARALASDCRGQLDRTGACELPGFIKSDAVAVLVREADELAREAYHSVVTGTAYLEAPAASWPADHPRRHFDKTSVGVVAYDQFPQHSPMRRLFEFEPLMEFIAAAIGKQKLYRYADPMGALNLAVMGDGERLHWHYDQTDFVTSIALRPAEDGGDFEYVPLIRSAGDQNYPRVKRLFDGDPGRRRARANASRNALAVRGPQFNSSRHADSRRDHALGRAARVRHPVRHAQQQDAADGPLWADRLSTRAKPNHARGLRACASSMI